MGDYTGFTFGGKSSSSLGIVRVSGGDRYDEELGPEVKDLNADIAGLDGEYFFGSNYGTRKIEIEIAYNDLTEAQFRELRKTFNTKGIRDLIFDERPYKRYMAKIESPIELSYVCFDGPYRTIGEPRDGVRVVNRTEEEITREQVTPYEYDYSRSQRIYKGEGKISFICYFPFAKSVYKVLPEGSDDWAISSGLLTETEYENFDKYDEDTGEIRIYNAGDVPTGFRLYLPAAALEESISLNYKEYSELVTPTATLNINPITLKGEDEGVIIDTNNNLIIGVFDLHYTQQMNVMYQTTGNLYNEYIDSGHFFRFEPNDKNDGAVLQIEGGADEGIQIFYDYLYF